MEATHTLKALLNFHLATDSAAVLHLPYLLEVLTADDFLPSSHLSKWTARLNSLLHSKDAGARWAGLCLAHRTSVHSKTVMVECAQSWLSVALPILSKKESMPILKASMNLCRMVFSNATDTPEFQRQVSTPNVPKFTAALIVFLEKDFDLELKTLAFTTLTRLIPLYPNIHRASHAALSTIVSQIFSQSSPNHLSQSLTGPASRLYAVLHLTGGKVGAANLWRKSLDDSVGSAWTAFQGVRTTFPDENGRFPQIQPLHEDPATSVILSIERLCTSIRVICDLLRSPTQRPVQVPVGSLAKLTMKMIIVTTEDELQPSVDPVVQAMEISVIPRIWKSACELIDCLIQCVGHQFTPYSARVLSYIAFHLEQKLSANLRLPFLKTVYSLINHCHPVHSTVLTSRLTRMVLSCFAVILPSQSDVQNDASQTGGAGKSKKGKKRARTYEGDELFKASTDVICPQADDAKALLVACDVMQLLTRNPDVSPAVHSMASRMILAVLIGLPQMLPAMLSPNPQIYDLLLCKVREMALELGAGTSSATSKSLGLVLKAASGTDIDEDSLRKVDILVHPRLPPLLRTLPKVESLALFRSEESVEEAETRESLGLGTLSTEPPSAPVLQDVPMGGLPDGSTIISSTSTTSISDPPVRAPVVPSASVASFDMVIPPVFQTTETSVSSSSIGSLAQHSVAVTTSSSTSQAPQLSAPTPIRVTAPLEASDMLDVDEEMPSINMDSDSDSE